MTTRSFLARALILLAFAATASPNVLACTACFGQSDSPMAKGMNMGIFTLLLVITCVLVSIAGFFVYLVRRGAHLAETHPPLANNLSENQPNV